MQILGKDTKQPTKPQINLQSSKPLLCTDCGHDTFLEASKFRVISRLLTGGLKDSILPVPVFLCANCGAQVNQLLPQEIIALELNESQVEDGKGDESIGN